MMATAGKLDACRTPLRQIPAGILFAVVPGLMAVADLRGNAFTTDRSDRAAAPEPDLNSSRCRLP